MSHPEHHSDVIEENIETHPVRLAIGVVIGAVALVVGIILLAQFAIGAYGTRSLKQDRAMAPDAVAKRLAPVARVEIDRNAVAAPSAAAAAPVVAAAIPPPAAKPAAATGGSGKATYDATCAACHGAGVAGAPKLGDKAAWSARMKAGREGLYAAALKGKGAMPPKGGNLSLPDADVRAAVDHMLSSVN
jgi:cytochrome c5